MGIKPAGIPLRVISDGVTLEQSAGVIGVLASGISTALLQQSAVAEGNILASSVSTAKLQQSAVDTGNILNSSISTAKLQASSVTAFNLAATHQKDVASGIAGLDTLLALSAYRTRSSVGIFGNNYTVVQGNWGFLTDGQQTDYESAFVSSAGALASYSPSTDLDEIKWPDIVLNAGTYSIKIVVTYSPDAGILELLHGTTSIGTSDLYAVSVSRNVVITMAYSPTARASADFRVRCNGKNASSSNYCNRISRIEIFKTA